MVMSGQWGLYLLQVHEMVQQRRGWNQGEGVLKRVDGSGVVVDCFQDRGDRK